MNTLKEPPIDKHSEIYLQSSTDAELSKYQRLKMCKRIIWSLMLMAACAELGFAVLNISAMPWFLTETMKFNAGAMALIMSAYLLTEALLKSPMGHLSDKYGRKRFLVVGPLICVLTSLTTLAVGKLPVAIHIKALLFAGLRALDGVGLAMMWPVAFATISEAVTKEERSGAMSILNVTYMLGLAFGPLVGGWVNDWFNTTYASFYVSASLFAVTVLVGLIFIPGSKKLKQFCQHEQDCPTSETETKLTLKDFFVTIRKSPLFLMLSFVTFVGIGLVGLIVKVYTMKEFEFTETQFGALLMGPAIAMAALSVPLGKLADKMGRAASVRLGLFGCALSMWCIAVFSNHLLLVVAGSIIGLGFLIALPAWLAAASEMDARRRGAYLGAIMTTQGLGFLVGAPIGGALYEHYARAPFIGCAILLTLSYILSYWAMKPWRENRTSQ